MVVNCVRAKEKNNIRTHSHDDAVKLPAPKIHTLETAIEWIADDELVEVTPKSHPHPQAIPRPRRSSQGQQEGADLRLRSASSRQQPAAADRGRHLNARVDTGRIPRIGRVASGPWSSGWRPRATTETTTLEPPLRVTGGGFSGNRQDSRDEWEPVRVLIERTRPGGSGRRKGVHMYAAVEWTQGIEDAWSRLAQVVPKLIYFLVILVVGLILARIISKAVKKLLDRVGADRFADRTGLSPHLSRAGFTLSQFVAKAVRLFIVFITITTAFAAFGPDNPVSRLIDRLVDYIPNVFVAGAIIAITAAVAKFVGSAIRRTMAVAEGGTGTDIPNFVPTLAVTAIWVVGAFAALDQLDVAPMIVTGVFYAALAIIVGVSVVAIGGGGIAPMRQRWERVLPKLEKGQGSN